MRKVITLQIEPKLKTEEVKARTREIISLFDGYLDEYPIKNARSKHAVMGPVAKILERAKAGQWDVEPLTGYALRVHEMNPRVGHISQLAVEKLHEGTNKLLQLCQVIPMTDLARTVEQIDYGLYFQRRSKGLVWLAERSKELVTFLHSKYQSDEDFAKAWGLKKLKGQITDQGYFGVNSKPFKIGNQTLQADMQEFYNLMKEQGENPEATLDEEIEE